MVPPFTAMASGYTSTYITAITYQNMSSDLANVTFSFYAENSATKIDVTRTLSATASSSLNVGTLSEIGTTFKGSVVMSSDKLIVATMVQLPQDGVVKNRPLSNGFSAGAPTALIATALRQQFNQSTLISVQNVESVNTATVTGKFYAAGSATPAATTTIDLPPGAAKYYDLGAATLDAALTGLPTPFNGSVVFTAAQQGAPANAANIVASAMELHTANNGTKAFEGVAAGANTVYMPSALCLTYGTQQSTFYAVQNTSSSEDANVLVTYSNSYTQTAVIAPGNKASFITCNAKLNDAAMPTGSYNGSATVSSTGGAIVAIGKVQDGAQNITSAFLGASAGTYKQALPYVRWAQQVNYDAGNSRGQRAFIAIQNLGGDIAAGAVTVKYYDYAGNLQGTHTLGAILAGAKVNSDASKTAEALTEFGYYGSIFGGGAIVEGPADSHLAVVVRIMSGLSGGGAVGEDYNGIDVP